MKQFRIFSIFLISLFFYISLSAQTAHASVEFITDFDVTYNIKESGIAEVTNQIILTNVFSNLYATSYSLVLDSISPLNVKAYGEDGAYTTRITTDGTKTTIKVEFPNQIVGKNRSRTFFVVFEDPSLAIRTGEVWEISIPRISEEATFSSYHLKLKVPDKFGQEAYISPRPRSKESQGGFTVYGFNKPDVEKTGVVAGFGAFQVFSFNLNYHLENPLSRSTVTEITLPPDTAYQRVYYDAIEPRPANMYVDSDGNWIAEYKLNSRERVDVVARGQVQIFSNYRPFEKPSSESLNQNLAKKEYWEVDNQEIVDLAKKYTTPKDIYNFVSTKLKYDYERVKPNTERLGAVKALQNPLSAICMEFTDLFIAIARAAGIPAREINGFAYTENPDIQPLSLVNDVLHAWPEYYDSEKDVWVPVDPTWGSTTGGVDYFTKLDLRHFTFVVHGKDSKTPYAAGSYKLGSNPQKDVYVSFGNLVTENNSTPTITAKLEKWIPLISNRLDVEVNNHGSVAIYDTKLNIFFDGVKKETNTELGVLMPFQTYSSYVEIPFSFLGTKTPNQVTISLDNEEITVLTNKNQVVIYNLLFIFIVSILILVTILFRLKKWKFPKKSS